MSGARVAHGGVGWDPKEAIGGGVGVGKACRRLRRDGGGGGGENLVVTNRKVEERMKEDGCGLVRVVAWAGPFRDFKPFLRRIWAIVEFLGLLGFGLLGS